MYRTIFAQFIALAFLLLAGAQKRVIRIGGVAPETNRLGQMNPIAQTLLAAYVMAMKDLKPIMKSKYNVTLQYTFHDSRQRFGWAVMSYIDMLTTSFGNNTLHGLVGAAINPITQALAFVSTDYNIAQVAYGANAAMFSSKTNYPTLSRIFPSDGFEAYALAEMVVKTFGWSRVVMVYSADTYGVTASQVFQYRLNQLGGSIVSQVKIVPGQAVTNVTTAHLREQLDKVAAVDGRIWVLLSDDVVAVQRFFVMAQGSGLLGQNTYLLGGSTISTPQLWQNTGLSYKYLDTIMDGYIGLQPASSDWMMTSAGKDFIARLRSQNASAWTNAATGKKTCSGAFDDANHKIFQIKLNNGTGACLGMDYSLIGLDGTLVTPLAAYMYDAVHVLVQGIVEYCMKYHIGTDGSWYVPDSLPGDLLNDWLIATTNHSGVTGPIQLSSGIFALGDYGVGDREVGTRFSVVNYQPGDGTFSGMSLKRVGTWVPGAGYIPCADDYITKSPKTGGCTNLVWGTPGNVQPSDRADPLVETMQAEVKSLIIALAVIVFVSVIAVSGVLIAYSSTRLLKASQLPMIWTIVVSMLFGAARIAVASVDIGASSCISGYWMGHLAFSAVIAMLAKTLRVHLIVNAKAMKKVKITTTQVVGFTVALISVLVILMTFITPLNALSAAWFRREAITGQYTYVYYCKSRDSGVDWILYTYEIILLIVAAKLCYDTRNVPDAVNEAPAIASVIFAITIVAVIAFSLIFVLQLDPWMDEIITAAAYFVSCMSIIRYYFAPKMYLLLTGADLDRHFKIVHKKNTHEEEVDEARKNKIYAATSDDIEKNDSAKGAVDLQKVLVKVPKTVDDCNRIIHAIQVRCMVLAQRDAMDMSNSISSGDGSRNSSVAPETSSRPGFESSGRHGFESQIEVHSQVEIQSVKNFKAHPQHQEFENKVAKSALEETPVQVSEVPALK